MEYCYLMPRLSGAEYGLHIYWDHDERYFFEHEILDITYK